MDFNFVTVYVKDMEESIRFYHGILGLEIQGRHTIGGNSEMAMLGKIGMPQIELLYDETRAKEESYAGFSIGIAVESLEQATRELEEKGFPVLRGPFSPTPQVCFSFVSDPNGIEIELIEHKK